LNGFGGGVVIAGFIFDKKTGFAPYHRYLKNA